MGREKFVCGFCGSSKFVKLEGAVPVCKRCRKDADGKLWVRGKHKRGVSRRSN
jgi:ribosomal protein L37AE/L43A